MEEEIVELTLSPSAGLGIAWTTVVTTPAWMGAAWAAEAKRAKVPTAQMMEGMIVR